MEFFKFFRLLP